MLKNPRKIIFGIIDGYCNLKCPFCFVNNESADPDKLKSVRGKMSLEDALKIYDEAQKFSIPVSPHFWAEPLLTPYFDQHLIELKKRNIYVTMDSNGLLLDEYYANLMVSIGIDGFSFSIDANSEETFFKMRGSKEFEKVKEKVEMFLRVRGDNKKPRIGVSFVETDQNKYEKDEFIDYWKHKVDFVRINSMLDQKSLSPFNDYSVERVPCSSLFEQMVINHNGDVVMCCVDEWNEVILGNVLRDGLIDVWNNEQFNILRENHLNKEYYKIDKCKDCQVWKTYLPFSELEKDGFLIRTNGFTTYYNRLETLNNWR